MPPSSRDDCNDRYKQVLQNLHASKQYSSCRSYAPKVALEALRCGTVHPLLPVAALARRRHDVRILPVVRIPPGSFPINETSDAVVFINHNVSWRYISMGETECWDKGSI